MTTDTRDRIIRYITYHGQARVEDLHHELQISKVAVHKQMRKLLHAGLVVRVGKPPLVLYTLPSEVLTKTFATFPLPIDEQQTIDAHFLSITPDGKLLYGMPGFIYWAQIYQQKKSFEVIAHEYVEILQVQKKLFQPGGWIDATSKLLDTFKETNINHLFFQDIYSYRTFGRTKLAKLVMYAKQTGERKLIDQVSDMVKPIIEKILKTYAIEAVAYIPPTIPRPLQFMDELESRLNLQVPKIDLIKVMPGDIPIPQKTLATLEERVINARNSIYLKSNTEQKYRNVLLIDDVAGSGASFHETAQKLRHAHIGVKNIMAFGIVGNIKGYEVVREI